MVGDGGVCDATRVRVPFAPSSVSLARDQVGGWMRERGGSLGSIDDARIVVSELVTNAILHARPLPDGCVLVCWEVSKGVLEVSVTDGGATTTPQPMPQAPQALGGRGIAIVALLAESWWTEETTSDVTVHARLAMD